MKWLVGQIIKFICENIFIEIILCFKTFGLRSEWFLRELARSTCDLILGYDWNISSDTYHVM